MPAARASLESDKGRQAMQNEAYEGLKARAYQVAVSSAGCGHADAKARGYADVFDLLMTDHEGTCQDRFLAMLASEISDAEARRRLLDGMAAEYAGTNGWMAYLHREDWRR